MNTPPINRPPKPKQKPDSDTLETDWIHEEELLRNAKELLPKQVLEKVSIRVVFVDSESNVRMDISYKQPLIVDVEKQQSILSKTVLLHSIQTAKTEYTTSVSSSLDSTYSVSFSVMDVLLWNVDVETDHLQLYAETLPPEWIGREFIKGNVFEDIVFLPSLCIFHSIQTVYVFLHVSFRKDMQMISSTSTKKYTRRRNRG